MFESSAKIWGFCLYLIESFILFSCSFRPDQALPISLHSHLLHHLIFSASLLTCFHSANQPPRSIISHPPTAYLLHCLCACLCFPAFWVLAITFLFFLPPNCSSFPGFCLCFILCTYFIHLYSWSWTIYCIIAKYRQKKTKWQTLYVFRSVIFPKLQDCPDICERLLCWTCIFWIWCFMEDKKVSSRWPSRFPSKKNSIAHTATRQSQTDNYLFIIWNMGISSGSLSLDLMRTKLSYWTARMLLFPGKGKGMTFNPQKQTNK